MPIIILKKLKENMFFYQNPFFVQQYPPQMFLYPAYSGTEQIPVFSPGNSNQNFPMNSEQNFGFVFGVKAEDGEERDQNNATENPVEKLIKEGCDSDYEPQKSRQAPFYKNKNTETNLSNQVFSFLSCEKSKSLVSSLLGKSELKIELFYKLMKKIKKGNRKYMNRTDIIDLVRMRQGTVSFRIYRKLKYPLKLEEIKYVLRILVVYFLRNGCEITLLTSKKMNRNTLMEHLMKKREFQDYFTKQLTIPN